jgi:tetratricopeptide (TPR) repeat protein
LCASEATASAWADQLLPLLRSVLRERQRGSFAFFTGTSLCYSALFKAGRHDEILALLNTDRHPIWPYLVWGGRVLAARGQIDEAIAYVNQRAGSSTSADSLACFAETLLLQAGRRAEAFDRYALLANQANTHLSTYRALAKKYPEIPPQRLLTHLVQSTPLSPGKWFATAKTLKLYDEATRLAWASACDPHTLLRAARDHEIKQPAFAMECALAALHWMAHGHGYELTPLDVRQAHQLAMEAATACQQPERAQGFVDEMLASERPSAQWMRNALGVAPVRR